MLCKIRKFILYGKWMIIFFLIDVDECLADPYPCHGNASCTNTDGSFECECNSGFDGNGNVCSGNYWSLFEMFHLYWTTGSAERARTKRLHSYVFPFIYSMYVPYRTNLCQTKLIKFLARWGKFCPTKNFVWRRFFRRIFVRISKQDR